MTRPFYETEADRAREKAVAERVAKHFGYFAKKLPHAYPIDYVMVSGKDVQGWLEIKCRSHAMRDYPTLMLSAQKYSAGLRLGQATSLQVNLAVQWSDALGFLHLPCDCVTKWGGRGDRGDWQDFEPTVHFGVEKFRIIA